MPRILHTADWQLGLKLRRLRGDRGAVARSERFRAVERIAAVAHERQVDVVVVAGDVFDDNQVSPHVVEMARDALRAFAPIPVLLLPGNHDAAEPGGVLERLHAGRSRLEHVHVALHAAPVQLGGVTLHPCPLFRRQTLDDPTRHLPAREAGDTSVRVAVAHGGAHGFGSDAATANLIDVERILARGFDYVALGDWHGLKQLDPRAWYPGAHERTRFKEQQPGHVLVVDLPAAGVTPTVEPVAVAGLTWHERRVTLRSGADVAELDAWIDGLPRRGSTLVRLHLDGALRVEERAALDTLLERHEAELMSLQVLGDDVAAVFDDDDLAALDPPGFLAHALSTLRAHDDAAHRDAAALLVRLLAEARA